MLAGWSSGSNYPLLGAVRSSAQMISYEVGMGLALVAVLMYSGTLRMSELVAAQDTVWNVVPQFPAFMVFLIGAIAETNRPPFDLAEAESELVAGFHTEYSGIKFAMFYLGEYVSTVTVAAVAVTLFLGGWRGYWPFDGAVAWIGPLLWFVVKVTAVIYLMILVRATLPRMRYDRLMSFGWKVLIPFGLVWVMITGVVVVMPQEYGSRGRYIAAAVIVGAAALATLVAPLFSRRRRAEGGARVTDDATEGERVDRKGPPADQGAWDAALAIGKGMAHRVQADVPCRQHRAVPEGDRAHPRAVAHRAAPVEPARRWAGEVHRLRAVRVRLPGRRDLGRGRRQRPRASREPG